MELLGLKPKEFWNAYLLTHDRVRLTDIDSISPDIRIGYFVNKIKKGQNETCFSFVKRVKKTLPNFPKLVIQTWLFEHNEQIDEIFEQPVERFTFKKSFLSLQAILDYNPQLNSPVDKNLKQLDDSDYQQLMEDPKFPMTRIREYLNQKRVWPCCPIIMDTSKYSGDYLVKGYPLNKPFDVLEGFRRFSVIKFYIGKVDIKKSLRIYSVLLSTL
ncbi:MAG: hypothetical protein RPT25_11855 [Cycloclasticus sp.]|jgi:hypothetical protein